MTAPPERLVVMLYDGAIRFFFQAAAAMREGARTTALRAAATAARRSSTSCSPRSTWRAARSPQRLEGIYVFCKRLLMEARLERDADKIDLVRGYLAELREAWAQIAAAMSALGASCSSLAERELELVARRRPLERSRRDRRARGRLAATLGPAAARAPGPVLERLAAVQEQIIVELTLARDERRARARRRCAAAAAPCAPTAPPAGHRQRGADRRPAAKASSGRGR